MRRRHARLAATSALAVATALFTAVFVGAALADSGHGNSGNAPGQQKQEQPAPPQPAPQQQSQSQSQQSSQQSSSQPGTKPSSTTKHDTDTKVGDNPDVSKRYGNGKTAAEIAKSRGAPDSQPLHGPGNSQPHKTYDCRHKSNKSGGVDVHAIKSYSSSCTATASTKKPEAPVKTPETPVKTPEQPSEHKVTLCHATGSATNPYVMITVDYHALKNGHTAAKGDIIPPTTINGVTYSGNWDANGQAIFNNGCKPVVGAAAPLSPQAAAQTPPPAVTTPAPPPTTVTTTTPTTTTVNESPVITTTVTVPSTTTVTVTTPTTATVTTPASSGGVLGAQTSLAKPKPASHHGVLGTVTHVTGGTLPFTGFPVWLAVLIAAALILGGIALRRRTAGARL